MTGRQLNVASDLRPECANSGGSKRAGRETLSQIYAKQADAGQGIAKSKRFRLLLIRGYVIWHALLNRSFALALAL